MAQKNSERKRTTAQLSSAEWRVRKQKRPEKQRHANGVRALKMRSARVESELVPRPVEKLSKFNIGCSGWFYWHWRQAFYPGDLPTKDWFSYYAANFQTVELNAPFYSWPTKYGQGMVKAGGDKRFRLYRESFRAYHPR